MGDAGTLVLLRCQLGGFGRVDKRAILDVAVDLRRSVSKSSLLLEWFSIVLKHVVCRRSAGVRTTAINVIKVDAEFLQFSYPSFRMALPSLTIASGVVSRLWRFDDLMSGGVA